MSKYRKFCITINNYTNEDVESFTKLCREAEYACFQKEVGELQTPHIQGYIRLKNGRTCAGIKRCLPRVHIEAAKGNDEQNRAYCSKPGGSDFQEFGQFGPGQGKRTDIDGPIERIRAKRSLAEVANEFPEAWIKYHRGFTDLAEKLSEKRRFKTAVHWLYGPTGTGKSRWAAEQAPDAYYKMGTNKWWDGYNGEDDVIIDDYRRDMCTFAELLRLFDRYLHRVETKGGSRQFVSRNIYITTSKSPEETWEGRTEEDLVQLNRRIENTRHFGINPYNPQI